MRRVPPVAGLDAVRRRLAALPARARAEGREAMRRIGADVLAAARDRLRRSADRRSAPGEAPDDAAGALAASLTARVDPDDPRLTIVSTSPHAVFLEYGTRRMGARPFLRPAVEATRAAALRHAEEALLRAAEDTS